MEKGLPRRGSPSVILAPSFPRRREPRYPVCPDPVPNSIVSPAKAGAQNPVVPAQAGTPTNGASLNPLALSLSKGRPDPVPNSIVSPAKAGAQNPRRSRAGGNPHKPGPVRQPPAAASSTIRPAPPMPDRYAPHSPRTATPPTPVIDFRNSMQLNPFSIRIASRKSIQLNATQPPSSYGPPAVVPVVIGPFRIWKRKKLNPKHPETQLNSPPQGRLASRPPAPAGPQHLRYSPRGTILYPRPGERRIGGPGGP